VAKTGIAIEEFQCLARCNGASCHVFRPDATNTVHHFRETVKRATSSNNAHLIVSYDRSVLLQTGTGHFSPIGGYYPEEDLVLILDVARFKYPPHWVPLELLYKAMQTVDVSTNKTRGYLLVSKSSTLFHTSLFCRVNVNQSNWKEFIDDYVEKMKTILKQENVKELIKEYVSIMEPVIIDIIRPIDAHFKEKELSCDDTAQSKEHLRLLEQFYDQVKQTSVYQMIAEERGENEQTLTQNVLLTVLLYSSTPVVPVSHCCRDNSCSVSTSATILKIPDELQVLNAEVEMIREQIKAIDLSCCKRIKN
jgi:glutathione gamma-glutamylcysteinyltransferase